MDTAFSSSQKTSCFQSFNVFLKVFVSVLFIISSSSSSRSSVGFSDDVMSPAESQVH